MVIGTVLTGRGERGTIEQVASQSVGERVLQERTCEYHRDSEMMS